MGFYFRKSLNSGPFKVNFSKSGISYSFGVKGARINVGNRGTYVNFGSNGIYYRRKISGYEQHKQNNSNSIKYSPITYEQHTITSSNVEQITDTDSQDFINELTEKGNKISYFNWFGIFPLIITTLVFLFTFFLRPEQQITQVIESKNFIKPSSDSYINIRQTPEKSSKVLGIINPDQQYELLDSINNDWFKIDFNGQDGFVSKKFTTKTQVVSTNEILDSTPVENLFEKNQTLFWLCLLCLIIFFSILLNTLKKADRHRLLVEIYYDIDEKINEIHQKFIHHFSELLNCSKVWQYLHSQQTYDYKYSSGADHTITRKTLSNISTNKSPSKLFKTNVLIPYLGLQNTELYFFPERLIIKRGGQYGAIMYKNIDSFGYITQFIESQGVPSDSIVVGQTWRYLNKNGTPDRRFNNNHQIPICKYSEYTFQSTSGLNEKIATSKVGGFDNFINYIKSIGQLQKHIPTDTNEREDISHKQLRQ